MPIISYKNSGTRDIAENIHSKSARRLLPSELNNAAKRRMAVLDAMTDLSELAVFPGWRLEQIKGDRLDQHSIRINDQYRICFIWTGIDVENAETVDYH